VPMGLDRKLDRWRDAGLIDEPTRARIAAYERSGRRPVVLYALAVLGAGTVALGIVSIIAANWSAISGSVKIVCDLLVGVALAAATYVVVAREHRLATEILVTLSYGYTLASLALVGQVYQLTTPEYRALLAWSIATLPLVLLARSTYVGVLVAFGIALTHAACLDHLFEYLERSEVMGRVALRNLAVASTYASVLVYVPISRIPWLVRERSEYARALGVLAWTAVLAGGFGLQTIWYAALDADETLGWSLIVTAVTAGALAAALPRLYPDMPSRAVRGLAAILGFGWLTLAVGAGLARGSVDYLGAILQIGWLGLFAWTVLQLGLLRAFNVLTALIAVRVLVVYFEVFGSLMSTGVGLISGGVLTLAAAYLWKSKTRELAQARGSGGGGGGDEA